MPIINGVIYPELRSILHKFDHLNILIIGDASHPELVEFLGKLIFCVRTYLTSENHISTYVHTLVVN